MGPLAKRDSDRRTLAGWIKYRILPDEEPLLARPQPLGFLPSHAFWRQWSNLKRLAPLYGVLSVAVLLGILAFPSVLGYPIGLMTALVVINELMVGGVERYVRKEALRRVSETPSKPALEPHKQEADER